MKEFVRFICVVAVISLAGFLIRNYRLVSAARAEEAIQRQEEIAARKLQVDQEWEQQEAAVKEQQKEKQRREAEEKRWLDKAEQERLVAAAAKETKPAAVPAGPVVVTGKIWITIEQ